VLARADLLGRVRGDASARRHGGRRVHQVDDEGRARLWHDWHDGRAGGHAVIFQTFFADRASRWFNAKFANTIARFADQGKRTDDNTTRTDDIVANAVSEHLQLLLLRLQIVVHPANHRFRNQHGLRHDETMH
jgi:hypothetical protein